MRRFWHDPLDTFLAGTILASQACFLIIVLVSIFLPHYAEREKRAMFETLRSVSPADAVYVHRPEDARWKGRARETEARLRAVIAVAEREHMLLSDTVPVKIGVISPLGDLIAQADTPSSIVVTRFFFDTYTDAGSLDVMLAHEFAHLLTIGIAPAEDHGPVWYAACRRLYDGLGGGHPGKDACRKRMVMPDRTDSEKPQ